MGELAQFLARWAIGLLVCHYLCQFTILQSNFLAIFASYVTMRLSANSKALNRATFQPFVICFDPQWYYILTDKGLIDDAEYHQLIWGKEKRSEGFRILHSSLRLTQLSSSLYYFEASRNFASELAFSQELEELVPAEARGIYIPRFYLKRSLDEHPKLGELICFEFGIATEESLRKASQRPDDAGQITLGRLPEAVLNRNFAGDNFALNLKVKHKDISPLLQHYGWSRQGSNSPLSTKILTHRYMKVTVFPI